VSRIFISYRRDDSEGDSGRIADRLIAHFGADAIFYDRESLRSGDPWRERIATALAGCETLLLVMGPQWETLTGPDGKSRLLDAEDMVAFEISQALRRRIRVIPVLVRRAELPAAKDLPPALLAVRDSQFQRLHADAFNPLMQDLINKIEGPRWFKPKQAVATVAGLLGVGLVALWGVGLGPFKPATPRGLLDGGAVNEQIAGELQLRLRMPALASSEADADADADPEEPRWLMALLDPVNTKFELPEAAAAQPHQRDYVVPRTLLPRTGERYEADLTRQVQSGQRTRPQRTTLCLRRSANAPSAGLRAVVACDEGERCTAAADNPGHFLVTCGDGPPALRDIAPVAPAKPSPDADRLKLSQSASIQVRDTLGASDAEIWAIPSLTHLHARQAIGRGLAYTEVTLSTPPLAALPALVDLQSASRVSVEIRLNGRKAWIDGLPPDSSAEPFDAKLGLLWKFGLENLDFAGANQGREKVELTLRFWEGKKLLRETQATLNYVALRSKEEPSTVGDPALGLRWSARFVPGRGDELWQVFLLSANTPASIEEGKRRFDAAGHALLVAGQTRTLVAVVRPPLKAGGAWGLNVGTKMKTGQIKFSFNAEESLALCKRLVALAKQPRSEVQRDTFRRHLAGQEDTSTCASLTKS
jgi:TIR domain